MYALIFIIILIIVDAILLIKSDDLNTGVFMCVITDGLIALFVMVLIYVGLVPGWLPIL